ncbi:hypothetical protein BKA67DRAFT_562056 [Truncatella angustata]|uniref:Zn(2)-C6 fungal-type domain-containing protein n=1 Tax=Truncatella angustata TaxID=152316 RepID=A0A9P8UPS2_9PEZI|nr:uncharacterized protein BKA67DRAFT_562056 [Truncatella angustata]KAH6655871.1 hypothetical protein BKA67DRAFT_562056 [Truncatella angustata]
MHSPPIKKRRAHYKSRKGCAECKKRHVKCDEQWPVCLQCSTLNRSCSYALSSSRSSHSASPGGMPQVTTSTTATAPDLTPLHLPEQTYDIHHLALFHHATTDLMRPPYGHFITTQQDSDTLTQLIISSALCTPFLMDELLAFASLHKSVLAQSVDQQHRYRYLAVQLQTRSLATFNTSNVEITEQNCVAVFIFSSFVGMHMLHDTVVANTGLLEVLERFMQFVRLYRGISVVTGQRWHIIRNSAMSSILDLIEAVSELPPSSHDDCAGLLSLLVTAKDRFDPQSYEACHDAIIALQWVFHQFESLPVPTNRHVILSWPVRVSAEFLRMLEARQPEALSVMAHWAVLLHRGQDFWIFGHGGRFLVDTIFTYLGPPWSDWMAWPRSQVAG